MTAATLTSKGQITVPKPIRDRLHISAGDKIEFTMDRLGNIGLRAEQMSVKDLKGIMSVFAKKTVTLEDMESVIKEGYIGKNSSC